MGIGTIMRARKLLMIISGEDKADITVAALCGEVTPQVPASIIQFHPGVSIEFIPPYSSSVIFR